MEEVKKEVIQFLKLKGMTSTGEVKTNKHLNKRHGRKCSFCGDKIKYGDECFTQTVGIKNILWKLQSSFHVNCF
tara:strand:+ start:259 stop:480 length:222 start_codon:yes stop_codon:yes gene_type:complete